MSYLSFFFLIREMSVFHIEFRPLAQIPTDCLVSCDPQVLASSKCVFSAVMKIYIQGCWVRCCEGFFKHEMWYSAWNYAALILPPPRGTWHCLPEVGKPSDTMFLIVLRSFREEPRTFPSGYRSWVDFLSPRVSVIETAICESQIS